MRSRWRPALLAGLFALVTACGSGGGNGEDGVASVSDDNAPTSAENEPKGSDEDKMRAYAKCMREHGVDMPDPEPGAGGGMNMSVEAGEKDKVDKANEACKKLLPNGGVPPKPSAEDLDRMREQAQCLRDHGIDVEDPTMDDPGLQLNDRSGDSEKVNKALEECSGGKGGATVHEDRK